MDNNVVRAYWEEHDEERKSMLVVLRELALDNLHDLGVFTTENISVAHSLASVLAMKAHQDGIALGYYYAKFGAPPRGIQ